MNSIQYTISYVSMLWKHRFQPIYQSLNIAWTLIFYLKKKKTLPLTIIITNLLATQRCILWVALRIADRGQNHDYIHETRVIFLTAEAQRYSNSITSLWKCHPQQWLNPVEHMGFGKPREKKEGKNKRYQWSLYFIRKKKMERGRKRLLWQRKTGLQEDFAGHYSENWFPSHPQQVPWVFDLLLQKMLLLSLEYYCTVSQSHAQLRQKGWL